MSDFTFPSLPEPAPVRSLKHETAVFSERAFVLGIMGFGTSPSEEHADDSVQRTNMQLQASRMPPPSQPLTALSTVRNADDNGSVAQPAAQLESAIVPPDFKRQKIPLEKGFSQMDWMKLSQKGLDLQGKPMNGVNLPAGTKSDTAAA